MYILANLSRLARLVSGHEKQAYAAVGAAFLLLISYIIGDLVIVAWKHFKGKQ